MAAKYYEKNPEILQRKACENYRNLFEEEKTEKHHQARERYRNLFVEKELSQQVKNKKCQHARKLYKNHYGEKRREYARERYKIFSKKLQLFVKV